MITTQQMPVALKHANSILKRRKTNRKTSLLIERAEGRAEIPEFIPKQPSTPAALAKSRSSSVSVPVSLRWPVMGGGPDIKKETAVARIRRNGLILSMIQNRLTPILRQLEPWLIIVLWLIAYKNK